MSGRVLWASPCKSYLSRLYTFHWALLLRHMFTSNSNEGWKTLNLAGCSRRMQTGRVLPLSTSLSMSTILLGTCDCILNIADVLPALMVSRGK